MGAMVAFGISVGIATLICYRLLARSPGASGSQFAWSTGENAASGDPGAANFSGGGGYSGGSDGDGGGGSDGGGSD